MGISYNKWMSANIDELYELFYVFTTHFPEYKENKAVYRDFCILIYNKTDEQSKSRRL